VYFWRFFFFFWRHFYFFIFIYFLFLFFKFFGAIFFFFFGAISSSSFLHFFSPSLESACCNQDVNICPAVEPSFLSKGCFFSCRRKKKKKEKKKESYSSLL